MNGMDEAPDNESPRRREERLMGLVARVAAGEVSVMLDRDEASLRELAYAAHLVWGCLDDQEDNDNLGAAIRQAAAALEGKPPDATEFVDCVQARWGAQRHLDAAKLRTETALHLLGLRRQEEKCR